MEVAGRPFTVVGAGRSGIAAANLLARRGADVVLVEGRAEVERPAGLHEDAAFLAGTNDARSGDVAVLSPGIPEVSPVRQTIADPEGHHEWVLEGEVDLAGSREEGRAVLRLGAIHRL